MASLSVLSYLAIYLVLGLLFDIAFYPPAAVMFALGLAVISLETSPLTGRDIRAGADAR